MKTPSTSHAIPAGGVNVSDPLNVKLPSQRSCSIATAPEVCCTLAPGPIYTKSVGPGRSWTSQLSGLFQELSPPAPVHVTLDGTVRSSSCSRRGLQVV